ncbi:uncharacterized protein LOC111914195 isoform X4 [Lactuca sativa]|nr:uncharacterized protein LOC111914195 isoform X4 [Lactuca sativa]XP_052621336.1 uncharacterized protein LOC111914195 isoform X4 [Lactuca sativa]
MWSPRQIGDSIGHIVIAHPSEGERYYLRILLSKVRCPKSYDDLKSVNGVRVKTFREAALLHGYLLDDNTQQLCLEEASTFHMPYELRRLFATLLVYTCLNNPRQLWTCFEDAMLEDILRCNKETLSQSRHYAFHQIDCFLKSMGKHLRDFNVLPDDYDNSLFEDQTKEIKVEKSIHVSEEDLMTMHTLNEEQQLAFNTIIGRVDSNKLGAFFIDGPGGTGKTFLYRALLAKIRSEGHIPFASNRVILTTKNLFVDEINDILINKFPGLETEYINFDETADPNDQAQYEDLLHSLTPNGMSPHKLILKYNSPIILLRNMNPFEGLCNGTRLLCKDFQRNVIRAEISYGQFAGKEVFIHRIPMQPPSGEQYSVPFNRFQFPIRLCFAMTINKAHGQTLDFVGVYLKEPVFSHGQL